MPTKAELQAQLDALEKTDSTKSGGFTRAEGSSGLKDFEKKYGNFEDYTAEAGSATKFITKRKKSEMISRLLIDSEDKHCQGIGETNLLQDENPDVDILVNSAGKKAKLGEECWLNEEIAIGRDNGSLYLS